MPTSVGGLKGTPRIRPSKAYLPPSKVGRSVAKKRRAARGDYSCGASLGCSEVGLFLGEDGHGPHDAASADFIGPLAARGVEVEDILAGTEHPRGIEEHGPSEPAGEVAWLVGRVVAGGLLRPSFEPLAVAPRCQPAVGRGDPDAKRLARGN